MDWTTGITVCVLVELDNPDQWQWFDRLYIEDASYLMAT